jgi:hypothetical protein
MNHGARRSRARTPLVRKLLDAFDDTSTAAAFAEEDEPATARQLFSARALGPEGDRSRGWASGARTP